MPRRLQQRGGILERDVLDLAREPAELRRGDADESVALAVLAGTGAEEAEVMFRALRIAKGAKAALDGARAHCPFTIQTSFENSCSLVSAARASASEGNFTRTRNAVPLSVAPRST
jgi:hypothetical protein